MAKNNSRREGGGSMNIYMIREPESTPSEKQNRGLNLGTTSFHHATIRETPATQIPITCARADTAGDLYLVTGHARLSWMWFAAPRKQPRSAGRTGGTEWPKGCRLREITPNAFGPSQHRMFSRIGRNATARLAKESRCSTDLRSGPNQINHPRRRKMRQVTKTQLLFPKL